MPTLRSRPAVRNQRLFRLRPLAAGLACALAALQTQAQQSGLSDLGTLGGTYSAASAVSADGTVVVGDFGGNGPQHAFRWTSGSGMADLGTLGGSYSSASAVSANGTVVVGYATAAGNVDHAFRWTSGRGMADLGTLGGTHSYASAVSADGTVVVGVAATAGNTASHAFRWTSSSGMADLGTLGGTYSSARAISADGSVVVGFDENNGAQHAFRWTSSSGMADLGTLGGTYCSASAISADGSVVVGNSTTTNGDIRRAPQHAFRWTSSGMADLGTLGGSSSYATAISADGSVVVGYATTAGNAQHAFRWTSSSGMADLGTLGGTYSSARAVSAHGKVVVGEDNINGGRAFRWTQQTGMISVEDWLRAAGVKVAGDITLLARDVSADGQVVVGSTVNYTTYIARVVTDNPDDSGLLALDATLFSSLGSIGGVTQSLLSGSEMVMNGMHSMPLGYRVDKGKSTVWGGGDWGRYTQDSATSGNVGVAEIGGGYNFGPVQVNAALGYSQNTQDLSATSTQKSTGTYLYGEALIPVVGRVWGIVSGYYQRGSADLSRGYLNAGTPTSSTGSPDTDTWALRTRLEWEALADPDGLRLNPYGEVSYARAKMDGYSETSGAWPASFASRTDNATDLRIGVNGAYPLDFGKQTRLLGVIEGVHRFQNSASDVNGKLLGPGGFSFSLPGASYDQNWMRAGIGAETMIGDGKVVVMLNGATRGESPNVWLNARYQLAF